MAPSAEALRDVVLRSADSGRAGMIGEEAVLPPASFPTGISDKSGRDPTRPGGTIDGRAEAFRESCDVSLGRYAASSRRKLGTGGRKRSSTGRLFGLSDALNPESCLSRVLSRLEPGDLHNVFGSCLGFVKGLVLSTASAIHASVQSTQRLHTRNTLECQDADCSPPSFPCRTNPEWAEADRDW